MVLEITPLLAVVLSEQARRRGVSPENLALEAIQDRYLPKVPTEAEHREWTRVLAEAASDCGVALSNEALSSEGLYD